IDQVRIFDFEEDADDASVRVLTEIGQDPTGVGLFLLRMSGDDAKQKCLSDVAARKPIGYGRFIDTHPSSCWRYYHTTQFAKALTQCPSTPPNATSRSHGSGRASIIDKAPKDMVEKGYGRDLK